MHESGIIANLIKKIEELARQNEITKVTKVSLCLGPFSQISPNHLREHFNLETRGSMVEDADLEIEVISEAGENALSTEILLRSIEGE